MNATAPRAVSYFYLSRGNPGLPQLPLLNFRHFPVSRQILSEETQRETDHAEGEEAAKDQFYGLTTENNYRLLCRKYRTSQFET